MAPNPENHHQPLPRALKNTYKNSSPKADLVPTSVPIGRLFAVLLLIASRARVRNLPVIRQRINWLRDLFQPCKLREDVELSGLEVTEVQGPPRTNHSPPFNQGMSLGFFEFGS